MTSKFRIAHEIEPSDAPWGFFRSLTSPAVTNSTQLTTLDATIAPGKGHDFHVHPAQEELIWIVAGQVEQWVDREMRVLGPGDAAFIPAGVVHCSFNVGKGDARMIAIFGPSVGPAGMEAVEVAGDAPWKGLRS